MMVTLPGGARARIIRDAGALLKVRYVENAPDMADIGDVEVVTSQSATRENHP